MVYQKIHQKKKTACISLQAKEKYTRKEKLENIRSLRFDNSICVMSVTSFSKGHLKDFFKKSHLEPSEKIISKNVVIDIRGNGGGDIQ